MDVILVRVGGYLSEQAIERRGLAAADGMRDDIAAELVTAAIVLRESQAACGEKRDALGEDLVALGEIGVDLVRDADEALDVVCGH